jgi:TolB-like protein
MNSQLRDKTAGVLTTIKLQALLDSGLNPELRSRKSLASALTQQGDKITLYGIEGWFKNVDSNYAITRESLHPSLTSYAIPKRRWVAILALFPVNSDDIKYDDEQFQALCFRLAKSLSQSQQKIISEHTPLVKNYVLYASADLSLVQNDVMWLREQGLNMWWDTNLADDVDWSQSASSVIESVACCLVYLSAAFGLSKRCQRELELVRKLERPIIVVKLDESILPESRFSANGPKPKMLEKVSRSLLKSSIVSCINLPAGYERRRVKPLLSSTSTADTPERPSIAVLPFSNLTGLSEMNSVAQGLTEDLLTLLSRISDFFVVSRYASNVFAGVLADYNTVAETLCVNYVLEGSVRKVQDKIRINCMLVEIEHKAVLWADHFEGEFASIWDVQDEITNKIVARLQPKLLMRSLDYGARTDSYQAWRCWQLGWYKLFIDSPDNSLKEAMDNFKRALQIQPNYALAHAGIANALATGMLWGGVGPEHYPLAKQHAETAFKLLPDNPAVFYAMGMIAFIEPRPLTVAKEWLEKALQLEPSNAAYMASLGYITAQLGDAVLGLQICARAQQLCPGDQRQPFINYMTSSTLIAAGEFAKAIDTMLLTDRLRTVDFVWFMVGFSWFKLNQLERTKAALKQCVEVGARPLALFHYSIHQRLWPQYSKTEKDAYLALCIEAGIN